MAGSLLFDVTSDGQPNDQRRQFTGGADNSARSTSSGRGLRRSPGGASRMRRRVADRVAKCIARTNDRRARDEVETETGVAFVFTEAVTVPPPIPRPDSPERQRNLIAVKPGTGGNVGTGRSVAGYPTGSTTATGCSQSRVDPTKSSRSWPRQTSTPCRGGEQRRTGAEPSPSPGNNRVRNFPALCESFGTTGCVRSPGRSGCRAVSLRATLIS